MDAMRRMKQIFGVVTVWVALAGMMSCSNDTDEIIIEPNVQEEVVEHKAVMHLTGGLQSYSSKKETTTKWNDGDVILLRFYLDNYGSGKNVLGKAVYDASASVWNISYYGNLTKGQTLQCMAYHFTNATVEDKYNISMSHNSCFYEDQRASYTIKDGELYVTATLAPQTARIRIKGTSGKNVTVSGVTYYTQFILDKGTFYGSHQETITTRFAADGYTPYIYCQLEEGNEITLDDSYCRYTKTFDAANFEAGKSYYIEMPTPENQDGWTATIYYPENAIDMGLSVRWADANLGADDLYDDGFYCSWGDAYGTNTSTNSDYNYNVTQIAGNPAYDIATRLWGERWQIPTQEQWQELIDNCTWEYWLSTWGGIGFNVTAKNGNSIFLPFQGYITGEGTFSYMSGEGYYWSSTNYNGTLNSEFGSAVHLLNDYDAVNLIDYNYQYNGVQYYKYYRMQIRPVLVK